MRESVELVSRWLWTNDEEDCCAIDLFVEGTTAITALPGSAWDVGVSMTGRGIVMEATLTGSCVSHNEEIFGSSGVALLEMSEVSAIVVFQVVCWGRATEVFFFFL